MRAQVIAAAFVLCMFTLLAIFGVSLIKDAEQRQQDRQVQLAP